VRDVDELCDHAVGVRYGVYDVAAYSEIESPVGGTEFEDTSVLKRQSRPEASIARLCQLQVVINDIDSEHSGLRKEFSQPRGPFARTATGIEYASLGRERIALN
jgi:hypothetical protein